MNEIIGILIFDSWVDETPEVRSSAIQRDRHLIYEGRGVILDLLLKKEKEHSSIQIGGQVLPDDRSLESVSDLPVCIQQGKKRCYTHTNALGEFTFRSIPDGPVDISISFGNRRFDVLGLGNKQPRMWRVEPSMVGGD
jgi:hypothetical protein